MLSDDFYACARSRLKCSVFTGEVELSRKMKERGLGMLT